MSDLTEDTGSIDATPPFTVAQRDFYCLMGLHVYVDGWCCWCLHAEDC